MPITRRGVKGSRLDIPEFDGNLDALDRLTPVVLTLSAAGVVDLDGGGPGVYHIQTFGGASTQNLTGIIGGLGHQWEITLCLATTGQTITAVHTPPNLLVGSPGSFILNSLNDTMTFRDRTTSIWRETGRSSVP
jgi:hypothetical protein